MEKVLLDAQNAVLVIHWIVKTDAKSVILAVQSVQMGIVPTVLNAIKITFLRKTHVLRLVLVLNMEITILIHQILYVKCATELAKLVLDLNTTTAQNV